MFQVSQMLARGGGVQKKPKKQKLSEKFAENQTGNYIQEWQTSFWKIWLSCKKKFTPKYYIKNMEDDDRNYWQNKS